MYIRLVLFLCDILDFMKERGLEKYLLEPYEPCRKSLNLIFFVWKIVGIFGKAEYGQCWLKLKKMGFILWNFKQEGKGYLNNTDLGYQAILFTISCL
ncbi:unnamed protein product [Blepharisma stoltei]|uniref:Uncharacterized protein n=1 Tax=Blepharisma stoltei TaxID=1481888 RepID=A0AAU9IJJ3_9CILI|nr:unnamed protein product [Blepharisma stoltei]